MATQSLQLLEQIIEMAEAQERELKAINLARNKGALTLGEGALLHHLRLLRELLEKEAVMPSQVTFGDKTFSVATAFRSPGLPSHADKLPEVLNIGRRARITSDYWGDKTWRGREGVIEKHFINEDDCSGSWGKEMYTMVDDAGIRFSANAEHCELC